MTPTALRRERIAAARAEIARLLAIVTQQPPKDQLALATRDVDEATAWLNQPDADKRPSILTIVDLALSFAEGRIAMVREGVEKFGPDVTMIG